MLRHCLWMAGISPAYALSAARKYEADSYGVLEGLAQKVEEAIERHKERVNAADNSDAPTPCIREPLLGQPRGDAQGR